MCVTDRGVGFEEEGESGFERECGLSEKAERGEGHPDYPLGEIRARRMLRAWCGGGSRSVALTEGSARTFGWQRSIKFL